MKKVIVAFILAFGVGMADELVDECIKDKSGKSCFESGIHYLVGNDYEKDLQQAEFFIKKACEKDKSYCHYEAKVDFAKARDYAKKACQKDNNYCVYGKYDKQTEIHYKSACEKDKSGFFCESLGSNYLWGIDYQQAEIYYKKACAKDKIYCNYEAIINNSKGNDYFDKKDYKQAEIHYKKACLKDKKYCDYKTRIDYAKGENYFAEKDYTQAESYYKSYECEYDWTCEMTGENYFYEKNYTQADFFFKKACEKADENSIDKWGMHICIKIAEKYESIDNIKQAQFYYKEACKKGHCQVGYEPYQKAYDYLEKKDYQQAEIYFKKMCEEVRQDCDYKKTINQVKGYDYFAKKDYKQADIYYKKACEKDIKENNGEACIDYMKGQYYFFDYYDHYDDKNLFEDFEYMKTQVNFYFKRACEKDKNGTICYEIGIAGMGPSFTSVGFVIGNVAEFYLKQACKKEKKENYSPYCESYHLYGVGAYVRQYGY